MSSDQLPVCLLIGCDELARPLLRSRVQARSFRTAGRAFSRAREIQPRVCLIRAVSGDSSEELSGFVERLRRELPLTDVLVWVPEPSAPERPELLRAGARSVLREPDLERVVAAVLETLDSQRLLPRLMDFDAREPRSWRFEELASRSPKMWEVFDLVARSASTDAPVLILGETGTGKELLARAFHKRSGRTGHFVALNCAAVGEHLIDSELFGHVRGAFTGADRDKGGLFRAADGGTLLLDEIGHVPLSVQHRLLRALQEGSVRPVGGEGEVPVDVRVIAATSRDLEEAVAAGDFRADLLYRLDVLRIIVPPLRERPEDILFLFGTLANKLARHYDIGRPDVSDAFLDAMMAHHWPGNVRELQNFTERLLLTQRGPRRTLAHFQKLMRHFRAHRPGEPAEELPSELEVDIEQPLAEAVTRATELVERAYLHAALTANGGRIGDTADQAGISRRTLLRKMTAFGLEKRDYR